MRKILPGRSLFLTTAIACLLAVASCSTTGTSQAVPAPTSAAPASPAVTSGAATSPAVTPPTTATQLTAAQLTTDELTATQPATTAPFTTAPPPTAPLTTAPLTPTPEAAAGRLPPVGLPGVNDPTCSSEHRPVVLLHGTFSTVRSNFTAMAAALQATDRCVFGLDYGLGGLRPVRQSAQSVTAFIDQVLAVTGADQVDVVAFSQGGLVLRTALRQDGLADRVATAVLIAPSYHGSTSTLLDAVPPGACPACADQAAGSALLAELDAGGDLDGGVRYAVISSTGDTVVTPVSSQVPAGPADRVRAVLVQDQCPGELLDHIGLPADPGVIAWTVDALDHDGRPDPAALSCR